MDAERFVLMGYSAGGYHAMMAALELKKKNMDVAAQALCYPFIKDAVDVYKTLSSGQRGTLAPALFILADNDPISDGSLVYEEALRSSGVKTEILENKQVWQILCFIIGVSFLMRSLSKEVSRKDRLDDMDERNRLIHLKTCSRANSITQAGSVSLPVSVAEWDYFGIQIQAHLLHGMAGCQKL